MEKRLQYTGIVCPKCNYPLRGLSVPVCPECGSRFNPDWLYSVDYEFSPWRSWFWRIVLALALLVLGAASIALICSYGMPFILLMFALAGLGVILAARRAFI